jgi:uncharacterized protein
MLRSHASRLCVLAVVTLVAGCGMPAGESLQPDPAFATVEVAGVAMDPRTGSPVVLLRDPTSERVVPIWIGVPEAEAIARALDGIDMPRPMTHDLLASTVRRLGARVEEVVIREQREGTYYGVIRLANGARGDRVELDSRPSDGVALALRTGAPIRVARTLLMDSLDDASPPPPRPVPTAA